MRLIAFGLAYMIGQVGGIFTSKLLIVVALFVGAASVSVSHALVIKIHMAAAEFAELGFPRVSVVIRFHGVNRFVIGHPPARLQQS